jgi:acyl-CoA synthetase (AMP-forming)/AMP-acid ligase II
MITLGSEGERIAVVLPVNAAFVSQITSAAPWPTGTRIELHFSNGFDATSVVWAATIAGTTATFNMTKTQVQSLIAARLSVVHLYYIPTGLDPLLWGHGLTRVV